MGVFGEAEERERVSLAREMIAHIFRVGRLVKGPRLAETFRVPSTENILVLTPILQSNLE